MARRRIRFASSSAEAIEGEAAETVELFTFAPSFQSFYPYCFIPHLYRSKVIILVTSSEERSG
jgi:hypothetical protein